MKRCNVDLKNGHFYNVIHGQTRDFYKTNADSGDEVAAALASDIAKMYASWRTTQDSANCGGNYHTVKEREG